MGKKKKQKCVTCETCENLIPCGEGDFICSEISECAPIMDYTPTDEYLKCGGNKYKEN